METPLFIIFNHENFKKFKFYQIFLSKGMGSVLKEFMSVWLINKIIKFEIKIAFYHQ